MNKYKQLRDEIFELFQQLSKQEKVLLLQELQQEGEEKKSVQPKNIKNLMNERGISKGMYGNVEGFLNNEENATKRGESAFKNKSMSDAIKAMRAKRNKK